MVEGLNADRCILFVCDVQDKFQDRIHGFSDVLHVASIMVRLPSLLIASIIIAISMQP
jgi:hypothetical protein